MLQSVYIQNLKIALEVGQLGLSLLMGVAFAALSYATWLVRGRSSTYYISQLFALGFIVLAVVFLLVEMIAFLLMFQ